MYHYFSVIWRVRKQCITCRRMSEAPIKLNQSSYREFQVNPLEKPFSYVFIDYIRPFVVTLAGDRKKVWLLILTCLWSRAVNLKVA